MKRYPTSLTIGEMKTECLVRSSHTSEGHTQSLLTIRWDVEGIIHCYVGMKVKVSTNALENNFVISRQIGDEQLPNCVL